MSKSAKTNKNTNKNIEENTNKNIEENTNKNIEEEIKQTPQQQQQQLQTKNIFQNSNLHSPYIETSLICPIMISPTQMDNKLQLHLKSNLNNVVKGKCYNNYGYIIKINKIEEMSDGIIEEEDSTCSAKYIVKFSCRLCYPAKNKEIICKIDRMNKALISGVNGPIKAIITPDQINKDYFFTDSERNIRIKETEEILEPEMYIKVLILASTFNHQDTCIITMSSLQNMATEQEIAFYEREIAFNNV
jgi:DNA-directed RNA polymerase subunit E'/Rpb7